MSHYNADYYAKQKIVREIRKWCELILEYCNPTFTIKGLSPKESEAYYIEETRIIEGSRS